MNPQFVKTSRDLANVRKEYMANLALQISNQRKIGNALQMLEETGEAPRKPADMRTQTELLSDIDNLKLFIRQNLTDVMDGSNLNDAVIELGKLHTLELPILAFVAQRVKQLKEYFEERFAIGVPSAVFVEYVKKLFAEEGADFLDEINLKRSSQATDPNGNIDGDDNMDDDMDDDVGGDDDGGDGGGDDGDGNGEDEDAGEDGRL